MAGPITFSVAQFGFLEQEVNLERQTLKGGTALNGETDVVSTDGGGRVFAEFGSGSLIDRDTNLAWRALLTLLEEGVTPVVVPFCDIRHTPYGGQHRVPHSDGTPFDDDAEYIGGGSVGYSNGAFDLRSTTIVLGFDLAGFALSQPLVGGEWFAIEHPTKGWRAYRVATIVAQTSNTATVTFRPPLREQVLAGTTVDFKEPRCLMVQDGRASNRMQYRRLTEAAIRFVEAP